MSQRSDRVASQIMKEASRIIQTEIKDPRVGFVTITKVDVPPDLRTAVIYYTVYGDDKTKESSRIGLDRAKPFIRRSLCDVIKFRFAPEIFFKFDKSSEYTQHIYDILDKIKKEKEEKGPNE